jgi:hypothetical protein
VSKPSETDGYQVAEAILAHMPKHLQPPLVDTMAEFEWMGSITIGDNMYSLIYDGEVLMVSNVVDGTFSTWQAGKEWSPS